jgi:hypothetical protein
VGVRVTDTFFDEAKYSQIMCEVFTCEFEPTFQSSLFG